MKTKFVVRRAVAGLVIAPAVAVLFFGLCALLVAFAPSPGGLTPAVAWANGWVLGIGFALMFVFAPAILKVLR